MSPGQGRSAGVSRALEIISSFYSGSIFSRREKCCFTSPCLVQKKIFFFIWVRGVKGYQASTYDTWRNKQPGEGTILWYEADKLCMARQNSGLKWLRTGWWLSVLLWPHRKDKPYCCSLHTLTGNVSQIAWVSHWDALDGLSPIHTGSGDNKCKRSVFLPHPNHPTRGWKLPSNQNFQNDQAWVWAPGHQRIKRLSV